MGKGRETGPAFRLGRWFFNHLKPRCAARQPKSDRQEMDFLGGGPARAAPLGRGMGGAKLSFGRGLVGLAAN